MMKNYDDLKKITKNTELIWKSCRGIVPSSVADKMDVAMLNWVSELTDALHIWINRGENLTEGELILAHTNIGALTECWLKFFYCVYYEDYLEQPKVNSKGKMIEPNKMSFEDLKNFSVGILWENKLDPVYQWVDKIQHLRNSIHAFNYRDIGTSIDFLNNIYLLFNFVDALVMRLPPIEDYMDYYPYRYP